MRLHTLHPGHTDSIDTAGTLRRACGDDGDTPNPTGAQIEDAAFTATDGTIPSKENVGFYDTSKQNDPFIWLEAIVERTGQHIVQCRRSARGPPMRVAYEHVRLKSDVELARSLCHNNMEDELATINFSREDDRMSDESNMELDEEGRAKMAEMLGSDSNTEEDTLTWDAFFATAIEEGDAQMDIDQDKATAPPDAMTTLGSDEQKVVVQRKYTVLFAAHRSTTQDRLCASMDTVQSCTGRGKRGIGWILWGS